MGLNSKSKWRILLSAAALGIVLNGPPVLAADTGNLYNTGYDINQGERYFERQCSRCHGFDAKGNDETGAPDLTGRLSREHQCRYLQYSQGRHCRHGYAPGSCRFARCTGMAAGGLR